MAKCVCNETQMFNSCDRALGNDSVQFDPEKEEMTLREVKKRISSYGE